MDLDWEVKKREKSRMTPVYIVYSLHTVQRMDSVRVVEEVNQVSIMSG